MTSSPLRVLVIGASGLVGTEVVHAFRNAGSHVVGAARTRRGEATVALDLEDPAATREAVEEAVPDVAVIASAWPHVDGCEQDPERSVRENVTTAANLVAALEGTKTRIVFYSTDHVFDGTQPDYAESDAVNPLSMYAKHKREVEEMLLTRGNALVIRTSWVFGLEARRKNFVYRVIAASNEERPLRVPRGQAGSPTSSAWLAEATRQFVTDGLDGVVHASGNELFTKASWAEAIVTELLIPRPGIEEVDIEESEQVAPRPESVSLRSERHSLVHPDVRSVLRANRAAFCA